MDVLLPDDQRKGVRLNDQQTIRLMSYNDPFSILTRPSLSTRLTFIRPQFSEPLFKSPLSLAAVA